MPDVLRPQKRWIQAAESPLTLLHKVNISWILQLSITFSHICVPWLWLELLTHDLAARHVSDTRIHLCYAVAAFVMLLHTWIKDDRCVICAWPSLVFMQNIMRHDLCFSTIKNTVKCINVSLCLQIWLFVNRKYGDRQYPLKCGRKTEKWPNGQIHGEIWRTIT